MKSDNNISKTNQKTYYVYFLLNIVNGKGYVGKSHNPEKRFKGHHLYSTLPIGKAIRKYRPENFQMSL